MCDTPSCDYPLNPDDTRSLICVTCVDVLHRALHAAGDLMDELEVTTTKQDRIRRPAEFGGRSTEAPLPYRPESAEHADRLHQALVMWGRAVAGWSAVSAWEVPFDNPDQLGRWLSRHMETIRGHGDAGAMVADIVGIVRACRHAIDHPSIRLYLGACGEPECADEDGQLVQLYAPARVRQYACPGCGAVHDVAARRAWLLDQLDESVASAEDLSRGLSGLLGGHKPLTVAMIHGWAAAGRLDPRPPDPRYPDRPLYRVGQVLDVVHEIAHERAARREARRQVAA